MTVAPDASDEEVAYAEKWRYVIQLRYNKERERERGKRRSRKKRDICEDEDNEVHVLYMSCSKS